MGSSSVGSDIFFAVALLAISLVVLLLIRYYVPLRSTPAYVTVPVFLAIALPASIILLVPIDLASVAEEDDGDLRGIWLPERAITVSWRILYWLTFSLTWAILPLLGEYEDAGYREPMQKFLYSLRSNGKYWAFMVGSGILGAVYFFLYNGFHFSSLKGLVMALAYAWGLVLAIYLMGHGLVAMPRRLFRTASVSNRLRVIQSQAPRLHDRLMDALDKVDHYENLVLQLKQRKGGTNKVFQDWIDELSDGASLLEVQAPNSNTNRATIPAVITERYLAEITRKVKRARHSKMRFVYEWDWLVRSAKNTQAILDSTRTHRLEFPYTDPQSPFAGVRILNPYTRFIVHAHIMPYLYFALGGVLSVAAVLVIWSSVVKSLNTKLSLIGLSVVHHPETSSRGQIGLAGQSIAAAWMLYMVSAALYSITEVKVWGNRALVRRATYAESACWYAMQLAKLSVPLSYNFITFLPPNIYRNTMFHAFLGKLIVLTPLGEGFQALFPMLILVPVIMTAFGIYSKIQNIFGFGSVDMMDDGNEGAAEGGPSTTWREGRALIERETQGGGPPSTNAVGLAARSSSPQVPARRSQQPAAPEERYRDAPRTRPTQSGETAATARTRLERATREARMQEEEEGGFLEDLGARLRNTFDTMERPKWMGGGNSTEGSPPGGWFAGLTQDGSSSGNGTSSRGEQGGGGNALRRWFGGASEGGVRL